MKFATYEQSDKQLTKSLSLLLFMSSFLQAQQKDFAQMKE